MTKPLEHTQRAFAHALVDAESEKCILDRLDGDERRSRNRLALYRGNLTQTWRNVLAAAYPVLHALCGDELFWALTREYGMACPSESGDLNQFGHRLAEVVDAWPPCSPYPYFADVARLEWAVHRAHFAADMVPLPAHGWLQFEIEVLEQSPLVLHPAVELIRSPWRVADIWLANQAAVPASVDNDLHRPQRMVVARPLWQACVVPTSPAAFCALDALRRGETMGRAIDAAEAQDDTFDFASDWRFWIEHAIVIAPDIASPTRSPRSKKS